MLSSPSQTVTVTNGTSTPIANADSGSVLIINLQGLVGGPYSFSTTGGVAVEGSPTPRAVTAGKSLTDTKLPLQLGLDGKPGTIALAWPIQGPPPGNLSLIATATVTIPGAVTSPAQLPYRGPPVPFPFQPLPTPSPAVPTPPPQGVRTPLPPAPGAPLPAAPAPPAGPPVRLPAPAPSTGTSTGTVVAVGIGLAVLVGGYLLWRQQRKTSSLRR